MRLTWPALLTLVTGMRSVYNRIRLPLCRNILCHSFPFYWDVDHEGSLDDLKNLTSLNPHQRCQNPSKTEVYCDAFLIVLCIADIQESVSRVTNSDYWHRWHRQECNAMQCSLIFTSLSVLAYSKMVPATAHSVWYFALETSGRMWNKSNIQADLHTAAAYAFLLIWWTLLSFPSSSPSEIMRLYHSHLAPRLR